MASGWTSRPTDRKATLPPDWMLRRARRFRRDGYQCTHIRYDTGRRCTAPATDCDHVGDRDDHSIENLTSLCGYHHRQKTAGQGGKAAARKRKKAGTLKHPGLL